MERENRDLREHFQENLKLMQQEYEIKMKRADKEREVEIANLKGEVLSLKASNCELLQRLSKDTKTFYFTKGELDNLVAGLEAEIQNLKNDKMVMKTEYEKLLKNESDRHSSEKEEIKRNHSDALSMMEASYSEAKDRFERIILAREDEIDKVMNEKEGETTLCTN